VRVFFFSTEVPREQNSRWGEDRCASDVFFSIASVAANVIIRNTDYSAYAFVSRSLYKYRWNNAF